VPEHILAVMEAEDGEIVTRLSACRVAGLVRAALDRLEPLAGRKELSIQLAVSQVDEFLEVRADPSLITRVLDDLLAHAARIAAPGAAIRVRVERHGTRAAVSVEASETRDRAGDRTADAPDLDLARRIVALHGGRLSRPRDDRAAPATVTLPLSGIVRPS
jgi:hypothetical protein